MPTSCHNLIFKTLPILVWLILCCLESYGQENKPNRSDTTKLNYKPEVLTSGFFDIMNNGQLNASARLLRLYIGEPGKFALPLCIYSGVSSNNFQNLQSFASNKSNENLVTSFINPLSGMMNLSFDGIAFFKPSVRNLSKAGLAYQIGEKVLTGYKAGLISDPSTGRPVNFLNSFAAPGFYFQTGAWEKNNMKNVGLSWFLFRYIFCYTNPKQLQEIIPAIHTNGFYMGFSLGWGVDINNLVNLKLLYFKYTKAPEIDYGLPIYQFSFNYSLK